MKRILFITLLIIGCDSPTDSVENSIVCDEGYSSIIGNGYDSDYWGDGCYCDEDIKVLEDFIQNSLETINIPDMELNYDGEVQWYELGHQEWEDGRLIVFSSSFHYLNNPDVPYHSNLSGTIPESITNWEYIRRLSLGTLFPGDECNLEGNIDILGDLSSLETLALLDNSLSGIIPSKIYDLTNLLTLYLARNSFEGQISSDIANLINLEYIWLGDNNLSGEVPEELWEINSLIGIELENNSLSGTLPTTIGNLTFLKRLILNDNNFSSTIPDEICNLDTLINNLGLSSEYQDESFDYFDISNNNFCPDSLTIEYPSCIQDYIGEQACADSIVFLLDINEEKTRQNYLKPYKNNLGDNLSDFNKINVKRSISQFLK